MGLLRNQRSGPGKSRDIEGILPEDVFRIVLERERALADRHDRMFSFLIFDLKEESRGADTAQLLGRVIVRRLRKTDIAGWIDNVRIGIILPYTTPTGAHKVAEDVCAQIADEGSRASCEIFTYPPDVGKPEPAPADEDPPAEDAAATDTSDQGLPEAQKLRPDPEFSAILAPRYPAWKRAADIVVSLAALILLSPVMLSVALLIKLVSPGPVLFKQIRVGHLQKDFLCWKFRTMQLEADTAVHRKHFRKLMHDDTSMVKLDAGGDPRLIPCGKIIRAMGLDELPQLFNVLRGDMSIIGPRPCIEYEFNRYERWQKRRCDTRPGLTGLWQVSGKNKTTFNEMMRYDISYADHKTLTDDLKIILRTVPAVLDQVKDTLHGDKRIDAQEDT